MGQEHIGKVVWGEGRQDLRMEAVLILTELASPCARAELTRIAVSRNSLGMKSDELLSGP